ncbi:MAG: SurA N-terminal domain-containing protein [Prevotellaceae bacterium]|jgi:peptidyl-prolyl cis-trans isomerase D|nr:SurA N-terminal domain-containing protein [Prevotellaceae bacterium]
MATLEKIRTRAGVITIIIGIALLSLLVNPKDIFQYLQSSENSVGEINGTKIDIKKFQKEVDYYSQISAMQNAGQRGEEDAERVRNQAWEKMVREYLLNDEFEAIGIGVSEKELADLAAGTNLSPVMRSYAEFVNPQTGEIYWQNIQMFWQNPNNSPQAQQLITYLEDEIKSYALLSKYMNLVNKANYINSLEIKRAVANAANSAEFNYIVERYMGGAEADSLYGIKESEAKNYYNKYKRRFEEKESRDIQMVAFPIIPSQDDYDFTKANIEKLIPQFEAATNLPQFAQSHSDLRVTAENPNKFDYNYYKQGDLSSNLDEFAFSAGKQDVFGPYLDGSSYKIARIEDSRMVPDSLFFKNMLLPISSQEDLDMADSIINLLQKGASWVEIARQHSADPQVAMTGGEIGWISYNQIPYPLGDSCMLNPTGKVMSMPVQGGYYVFQASQKSKESRMVRLAVVQKDVNPSEKTDAAAYERASQLAALSQNGIDAFRKAVEENGYTPQTAPNIARGSKQILSMDNAQSIANWLYSEDTKKNSVSRPINVNRQFYVVAVVTETREEGIAPFDQVKYTIGEELKKEKQAEAFTAKIKDALTTSNSLEELASKLNLNVLQVTNPVTFGSLFSYSSYIPGLGLEPKVAAAATTISELNKISEPIAGTAGVYVISLTDKKIDEGYTEEMARQTLAQEARMKQMDWYSILLKAGNVKDQRSRFY